MGQALSPRQMALINTVNGPSEKPSLPHSHTYLDAHSCHLGVCISIYCRRVAPAEATARARRPGQEGGLAAFILGSHLGSVGPARSWEGRPAASCDRSTCKGAPSGGPSMERRTTPVPLGPGTRPPAGPLRAPGRPIGRSAHRLVDRSAGLQPHTCATGLQQAPFAPRTGGHKKKNGGRGSSRL